mmetsp:Transcript_7520/g.20546  ORF Transcript_7520/g.20546 Transcript_7520/m.20546 type:complete len:354 (-) Transcript_7520:2098-3159(-)
MAIGPAPRVESWTHTSPMDSEVLDAKGDQFALAHLVRGLKVARVEAALQLRVPRGLVLEALELVEVEGREEWVVADVLGPSRAAPDAVLHPPLQQLGDHVLELRAHLVHADVEPELVRGVEDVLAHLEGRHLVVHGPIGLDVEGGASDGHLVEEDAKGPIVHLEIVPLHGEHLGRQICVGAAHRVGARGGALGEAKVDDFAVAVCRDYHILRLEVAVHVSVRVHGLEAGEDARAVEAHRILAQHLVLLAQQEGEELATKARLHHQQEVRASLEGAVQTDDKGVVRVLHHVALHVDGVVLLVLAEARELDDLCREGLARGLVHHEVDGAVGALADLALKGEIAQVDHIAVMSWV